MEFSTAVRLIKNGVSSSDHPQCWADLGSGDGFFTNVIASLLPKGSSITAVDKNKSPLDSIRLNTPGISLKKMPSDFTSMNWGDNLDGILLANALHYVNDQASFLRNIRGKLSSAGRIVIVEYERRQANQWVPYPIRFDNLQKLAKLTGYSSITKLDETPSIYEGGSIYSALLMR